MYIYMHIYVYIYILYIYYIYVYYTYLYITLYTSYALFAYRHLKFGCILTFTNLLRTDNETKRVKLDKTRSIKKDKMDKE